MQAESALNPEHLKYCASDEWADIVQRHIIPWTLEGVELGDDVLEVGPGPGRTTDILRSMAARVTAVEIDADLAAQLRTRLAGTNVEVVKADATALPLPDGRFSAALSFTMLHHVPSVDLQDRLLAELARVLRPGAHLAGVDSLDSQEFRDYHEGDTCVPIPPEGIRARLEGAGFVDVSVATNPFSVRFQARKG